MLCFVMLCYVMLCYVMLCYVMLCYVMLCYVMLCYVMLCFLAESPSFLLNTIICIIMCRAPSIRHSHSRPEIDNNLYHVICYFILLVLCEFYYVL